MSYQLSNGLERLFLLVGVPSPKVSLAWAVFYNSTTGETVGLTVSNRRTVGFKRVKEHRVEVNFDAVTVEQLESLVARHCPYIKKLQQTETVEQGTEEENEGEGVTTPVDDTVQAQNVTELPKQKRVKS